MKLAPLTEVSPTYGGLQWAKIPKEQAIAKVTPPATTTQGRYKPPDAVLAFLSTH